MTYLVAIGRRTEQGWLNYRVRRDFFEKVLEISQIPPVLLIALDPFDCA